MRAIAQDQTDFAHSYWRPVSETSSDVTEIAVVVIWGLAGLTVSALCNLSSIYAGLGEIMAFAG